MRARKRCKTVHFDSEERCVDEYGHLGPCVWSEDDRRMRDSVRVLYNAQKSGLKFAMEHDEEIRSFDRRFARRIP